MSSNTHPPITNKLNHKAEPWHLAKSTAPTIATVAKMAARIVTTFLATVTTALSNLADTLIVARTSEMALCSAVKVTVLCNTGPNEVEEPRTACAGVPTLSSPDKQKLAASNILAAAKGKRKKLNKPRRLCK